MLITEIKRPRCHSPGITRNGKKAMAHRIFRATQNYLCKNCGRQFRLRTAVCRCLDGCATLCGNGYSAPLAAVSYRYGRWSAKWRFS
jgi:hypothetical protein